jgi:hypothetical protein
VQIRNLTPSTVKIAATGAAQYVQDEKIRISKDAIKHLQRIGSWPQEYLSYVNKESKATEFTDPNMFFTVMHARPKDWSKRFIFYPLVDASDQIKEATLMAFRLTIDQARNFKSRSGLYGSSFIINLDGAMLSDVSQLDNLNARSRIQILNRAPYAGALEANAVNVAKFGGVLYFAAKKVQKAFPRLGVSFSYFTPTSVRGAVHKYNVPVIEIGNKGVVRNKLKRPVGKATRDRRRTARHARLAAKGAARTAAARKGGYG